MRFQNHVQPLGEQPQAFLGQIALPFAVTKVKVGIDQPHGDTGADARPGAVGRVDIGRAMTADDVLGVDIVVHAADSAQASMRRGLGGVDDPDGSCKKTRIEVDAVDDPVRKEKRGIVEFEAFADFPAKLRFTT